MEKQSEKTQASYYRTLAEESRKTNLPKALERIGNEAKRGFTTTVLSIGLGEDEIRELLDRGFSVGYYGHPFDGRRLVRVNW